MAAQGNYEDAKPLYERSLAIREKVLGPDHPDVATCLNNLAGLLESQVRGDTLGPSSVPQLANVCDWLEGRVHNCRTPLSSPEYSSVVATQHQRWLAIRKVLGTGHME